MLLVVDGLQSVMKCLISSFLLYFLCLLKNIMSFRDIRILESSSIQAEHPDFVWKLLSYSFCFIFPSIWVFGKSSKTIGSFQRFIIYLFRKSSSTLHIIALSS